MKKGFTLKISKVKKRYTWILNPVTRIKESRKIYRREREKERLRREEKRK